MTDTDNKQIGGDHYKSLAIQPWDAMRAWMSPEMFHGFLLGNAIKYLARYRNKNGAEDLQKAAHYLEKLTQESPKQNMAKLTQENMAKLTQESPKQNMAKEGPLVKLVEPTHSIFTESYFDRRAREQLETIANQAEEIRTLKARLEKYQ